MSDIEKNHVSLWFVPIVGLAFASTSLSWSLFNNIIPIFLKETYNLPLKWVGFIMTWDNIIGFFVQPWIGGLSDRTHTRFGRRMPFIIPGMLLGAIFFYVIYLASGIGLYVLLLSIVVFNLSMALYRSPAVSLMPDLIASKDRTIGNGIINLMGGVFAAISLFIGGGLLKAGNTQGAFIFISVGMIVSLIILVIFIREPKIENQVEEKRSVFTILRQEGIKMMKAEDKSLLFMLLAILSWFMAWNAIEAFYSTYVHEVFLPDMNGEQAAGVASKVMFIFPVIFVSITLVGGFLGKWIGRRRTMQIGLTIMTLAIFLGSLVKKESFIGISLSWQTSFTLIFVIAGFGWGLVNINSIVVVWEHSIDNGVGTGFYYAFSSAAAILGPTIAGFLIDVKISFLFPFSIFFLILALIFLFMVKTGEAGERQELIGEAIEEALD